MTGEPREASHTHHTHSLAELFPALEEVLRGHLSRLEELIDGDRQFESQVLQSSSISDSRNNNPHKFKTS